jgi:hypothetical protein
MPDVKGSRSGARSRLSDAFIAALESDWELNGAAALERVRAESPTTYAKLALAIVPQKVETAPTSEFAAMTDEELDAWLKEHFVKEMANDIVGYRKLLKKAEGLAKSRPKPAPLTPHEARLAMLRKNAKALS